MISRIGIFFIAVVLILLPLSCAKIEKPPVPVTGQLTKEKLPDTNTIPLKWGRLISVTRVGNGSRRVQLWFQDEDGNVREVLYYFERHHLGSEVRLITRK